VHPILEPAPSYGRVAVIADAHLGRDRAAVGRFLALLGALRDDPPDALVVLGDLFEVWVGYGHLTEPHHREVLAALDELGRGGVALHYVAGNRDFWVERHPAVPFHRIHAEGLALRVGGRRVWLEHGDLVNRDDRQYRVWRRAARSLPARLLARVLPGPVGRALVRRLESALRGTNLQAKSRFPEEAARARLRELASRGCELALVGHFHEARTVEEEGAELRSVPAWYEAGEWLDLGASATLRSGPD
jgi:UDP-2,3-diacylglucosamine hydrolase